MRKMLPWIFWAVVLAALTAVAVRDGREGIGMTNPRSLSQSPSTPAVTKQGTDCVGDSLTTKDQLRAKR
jgi:hypothetical protein